MKRSGWFAMRAFLVALRISSWVAVLGMPMRA